MYSDTGIGKLKVNKIQTHSVKWDYSKLAGSYDKRADYSHKAVDNLLSKINFITWKNPVADIGAGTGKLTKVLLQRGLTVKAIEPNTEMRRYGIANTKGKCVEWLIGTGENTTLAPKSVSAVFFGSSFNVVNRKRALVETARILEPNGWFTCMWNHRNIRDELQASVEEILKKSIVGYEYGSRREDQSLIIDSSGLFHNIGKIEQQFVYEVSVEDYIDAWRSHATLQRQAGDKFEKIVSEIADRLSSMERMNVPYTTRIWFAQLK